MTERLTCILCPVGCELEVDRVRNDLEVRGNQCEKGIGFAEEEILHPMRNLATSIPLRGTVSQMVSVRLSGAVPRDKIFPILAEIAGLRPDPPILRGRVLIPNILGTGVDVIATRTIKGDAP